MGLTEKEQYDRRKNDPEFKKRRNAKARRWWSRHRVKSGKETDMELFGLRKLKMPSEVARFAEMEEKFRDARDEYYRTEEGKRQHERLRCLEGQYQFICGVYSKHDERMKYGY